LPTQYEYRPTPKSRSISELLKYLTYCGYGSLIGVLKNDKEMESFKDGKVITELSLFPSAIDFEFNRIKTRIHSIDDNVWNSGRSNYWWGLETSLQAAIVETSIKCLTAYRMNLFLWAKEVGNHDLDRTVCWAHP